MGNGLGISAGVSSLKSLTLRCVVVKGNWCYTVLKAGETKKRPLEGGEESGGKERESDTSRWLGMEPATRPLPVPLVRLT